MSKNSRIIKIRPPYLYPQIWGIQGEIMLFAALTNTNVELHSPLGNNIVHPDRY